LQPGEGGRKGRGDPQNWYLTSVGGFRDALVAAAFHASDFGVFNLWGLLQGCGATTHSS